MKSLSNTEMQRLSQSLSDDIVNDVSLEHELLELEECPANFINSICRKSYDEMSDVERSETIAEIAHQIKIYFQNNK